MQFLIYCDIPTATSGLLMLLTTDFNIANSQYLELFENTDLVVNELERVVCSKISLISQSIITDFRMKFSLFSQLNSFVYVAMYHVPQNVFARSLDDTIKRVSSFRWTDCDQLCETEALTSDQTHSRCSKAHQRACPIDVYNKHVNSCHFQWHTFD